LSIYDSLQFSDSVILRFQKYKLLVSTCLICFKLLDPWSKTNLNISWTLTLMHVMTRTWPETVLLCYVVRFRQHLHLSLSVLSFSLMLTCICGPRCCSKGGLFSCQMALPRNAWNAHIYDLSLSLCLFSDLLLSCCLSVL
jgi:hypothetical protein